MGDELKGIEEDVVFDFQTAEQLITACNSAASSIENHHARRVHLRTVALEDFKGHFSQLFRTNGQVADADATELCGKLRDVATQVGWLRDSANAENDRRAKARAWKKEQDDRHWWEKGADAVGDFFGGDDRPPVGPPDPPKPATVDAPPSKPRQTPAPGRGGGGGGGTSSARPSDLRTFADQSQGIDAALEPRPYRLRSLAGTFNANTEWGELNAEGVWTGYERWLQANHEDVRWARVVANAFAAAGGEGNVSTLSNSSLVAALKAAGVDATRDDIVMQPAQAFGHPPTTGYADDPVNTATGNFLEDEVDLGFPGAASGLTLSRTYNSRNTNVGAFGPGWSSMAEAGLLLGDEAAQAFLHDGRMILFPRLGAEWAQASGENAWLAATESGYRLTDNTGAAWDFSGGGRLASFTRGPGTTVTLTHDDEQRLVGLAHERGRSITLTWDDGLDRIVSASTSDGRVATYSYDEAGRLTAATTPAGTRRYDWNDHDLVVTVTDPDGVVEVDNTYDEHRRVTSQRSQFGRTSRYAYLPGGVTVVSDLDGTRSNTWIADQGGRLIGVIDTEDNRQSMAYDRHGNLVMATERDGAVTVHEYDARGHRVRTVTPAGADLQFTYDELDRVTTVVTDAGAVTELSYDRDERHPSRVVDAEGGVTELTWERGLLTRVVDPNGVTATYTYDDHGDLVGVTDVDGNTARLERDAIGRVVKAITPLGHETSYAYSPAGFLASRRDPDGATWTYEHSAAGRLTAVVDPTGARTTLEHGAHGEAVRTVDPIGRATTRDFDDLGNLAAVELPDGSTWRFTHDGLSRRTATTAPTGATWVQEYDAVGTLTASVDPTGARRQVSVNRTTGEVRVDDGEQTRVSRFDPLGRLTSATGADDSAAVLTYDRCGRVVESLDHEGGLTTIRRDAGGRPVEVVSPSGATVRYEYNPFGLLAAVVDAAGGRTTFDYDADRRLVRQTYPAGEQATWRYDPCGRVRSRFVPGFGSSRYEYDAAGRIVEARDPRHGRRRFHYDAAGQLTSVVDGNGGVTRYEYDANGRAVAITDPLGAVTRREFDGLDRCVLQTDPLGRTLRAGYDAAGRQVWQDDPDGRRISWSYDHTGRLSAVTVDGTTISSISRDARSRTVTVTDHSGDGFPMVHELEYNARGQLVRRARDGRAVRWEYDVDGRRTAMVAPDGTRTSYTWDAASRLASVEHPLLGRAVFAHDASGRVTSATAGDVIQSWTYADGFVVSHTLTDPDGAARTDVTRGEDGRIVRIDRDGTATDFDYDEALQLIEARTGGSVARWRYDAAGRLVAESVDGTVVDYTYDAAGQLLARTVDGRRLSYSYDSLGRRTHEAGEDGTGRTFEWAPNGYLRAVTHQGERTELRVDATGELASVGGADVFWDSALPGGAPVAIGDTPVLAAGPVTGVGTAWTAAGWRRARATGPTDPWTLLGATDLGGVQVGPAGELLVAGLEWMRARAYDPATRGFLSTDPLDPVPGAGWAGNPYSFAGNDPLHALDPLGLSPLTEEQLDHYMQEHAGLIADAGHWLANNWEYIAAGVMIAGGGALLIFGGPLGAAVGGGLISAGIDTAYQKATKGSVNPYEVLIVGVAGTVTGGAGVMTSAAGLGTASSIAVSAGVGGVVNTAQYAGVELVNGRTPTLKGAGISLVSGAGGGALGPLAGAAGTKLGGVATSPLARGTTFGINAVGGTGIDAGTDYVSGEDVNLLKSGAVGVGGATAGLASDIHVERALNPNTAPTVTPDGTVVTVNPHPGQGSAPVDSPGNRLGAELQQNRAEQYAFDHRGH